MVMVPQEHIAWMKEQPDDILSARNTQVSLSLISFLLLLLLGSSIEDESIG